MIKKIIWKFRNDAKSFFGYPECSFGDGLSVDYDAYWKKRRKGGSSVLSPWQKQRADEVIKIIDKGSNVMDLGCGDGAVLSYMAKKAQIAGVGIDISDFVLEQAKKLGIETIKFDINDFEKIDELPSVDYVTGFEIIEHMNNPEEFIFKISKKARKGLIFSVPNTGYYAHRLRLLFGRFPLQWATHPGEHVRFWTMSDMKSWTTEIGFDLEKLIMYEGVPGLNKLWPSMFAQGMIVFLKSK